MEDQPAPEAETPSAENVSFAAEDALALNHAVEKENRITVEFSRLERAKRVMEMVAIVAAGVWAIYTFIYEDKIKPFQSPPAVEVDVSLGRAGATRKAELVKVSYTFHNIGRVRTNVVAFTESLYGFKVVSTSAQDRQHYAKRKNSYSDPFDLDYGSKAIFSFTSLLNGSSGGGAAEKIILDPGQSHTHTWIFPVARNKYDVLSFDVWFVYTKKDSPVPIVVTMRKQHDESFQAEADPDKAITDASGTFLSLH